jgi:hypothetical protein
VLYSSVPQRRRLQQVLTMRLLQAGGSLDTPATQNKVESETRRLIQEHGHLDAVIAAYGSGLLAASCARSVVRQY